MPKMILNIKSGIKTISSTYLLFMSLLTYSQESHLPYKAFKLVNNKYVYTEEQNEFNGRNRDRVLDYLKTIRSLPHETLSDSEYKKVLTQAYYYLASGAGVDNGLSDKPISSLDDLVKSLKEDGDNVYQYIHVDFNDRLIWNELVGIINDKELNDKVKNCSQGLKYTCPKMLSEIILSQDGKCKETPIYMKSREFDANGNSCALEVDAPLIKVTENLKGKELTISEVSIRNELKDYFSVNGVSSGFTEFLPRILENEECVKNFLWNKELSDACQEKLREFHKKMFGMMAVKDSLIKNSSNLIMLDHFFVDVHEKGPSRDKVNKAIEVEACKIYNSLSNKKGHIRKEIRQLDLDPFNLNECDGSENIANIKESKAYKKIKEELIDVMSPILKSPVKSGHYELAYNAQELGKNFCNYVTTHKLFKDLKNPCERTENQRSIPVSMDELKNYAMNFKAVYSESIAKMPLNALFYADNLFNIDHKFDPDKVHPIFEHKKHFSFDCHSSYSNEECFKHLNSKCDEIKQALKLPFKYPCNSDRTYDGIADQLVKAKSKLVNGEPTNLIQSDLEKVRHNLATNLHELTYADAANLDKHLKSIVQSSPIGAKKIAGQHPSSIVYLCNALQDYDKEENFNWWLDNSLRYGTLAVILFTLEFSGPHDLKVIR